MASSDSGVKTGSDRPGAAAGLQTLVADSVSQPVTDAGATLVAAAHETLAETPVSGQPRLAGADVTVLAQPAAAVADAGQTVQKTMVDPVLAGQPIAVDPQATLVPQVAAAMANPGDTLVGGPPELEDYIETLNDGGSQGGMKETGAAGKVIGDYEILQELGRGGMGVVYKARHRILKRTVALKMILAGTHSSGPALQRFLAEARAVAHLQHPGIVQIFDMGQQDGLPWFSLEFVDGSDLQKQLDGKPREARSAALLVETVCRAMQYAHDNGILHRDLKPANILMDSAGNPKVTDFGLAKEVDGEASTATRDGTIMGSPSYMPPEQARGQISAVTAKSDQYSMGAVLYQMLTARPPFITDRPLETVMQVINNEPVAPRQLQPGIPVDLETICLKALQKDPVARYENCGAMADDLRRFLNGEPILARPISRVQRAYRWCRRNPRIAVPSGLAGLFIFLTALISSWAWAVTSAQALQIADEKKNVEEQRDEAGRQRDEAERQRVIANQQKAKAEENELLAQKQANLALKNIQFVLTETDTKLKEQPGMSEVRIAILDAVSKEWDKLDIEMTGGVRGEAIPTLMALRQQMGLAFFELDKLAEADREFQRLYDMSAERIALKGRTDAARSNRARIALVWTPVKKRLTSEPAAAMTLLNESEALARECLSDPHPLPGSPSKEELQELLSAVLQNKAVENLHQGQLIEGEKNFAEALQLIAAVLQTVRSAPDFAKLSENEKDALTAARQINHDKLALGLAYVRLRLGRTEESLVLYDQAIAGRREIFQRRSGMLPLKLELGGHLGNYGQSLIWLGQLDKAAPMIRESLQLLDEVHAADPQKADYKRQLSVALYRMATLRELQGEAAEATSLQERCRVMRQELVDASNDEKNQINLMLINARCGLVEPARRLIDELGALPAKNGELQLERARALSQLSVRAAEADRAGLIEQALTALERAVSEGYGDAFRVKSEPDLLPLRNEARFSQVLAGLAGKP